MMSRNSLPASFFNAGVRGPRKEGSRVLACVFIPTSFLSPSLLPSSILALGKGMKMKIKVSEKKKDGMLTKIRIGAQGTVTRFASHVTFHHQRIPVIFSSTHRWNIMNIARVQGLRLQGKHTASLIPFPRAFALLSTEERCAWCSVSTLAVQRSSIFKYSLCNRCLQVGIQNQAPGVENNQTNGCRAT